MSASPTTLQVLNDTDIDLRFDVYSLNGNKIETKVLKAGDKGDIEISLDALPNPPRVLTEERWPNAYMRANWPPPYTYVRVVAKDLMKVVACFTARVPGKGESATTKLPLHGSGGAYSWGVLPGPWVQSHGL